MLPDILILYIVLAPGLVALTWTEDRDDPQYQRSAEAHALLETVRDAKGRELEIVKLPAPGPLYISEAEAAAIRTATTGMARGGGQRLAASYANFYISNAHVIVPTYRDANDERALGLLREAFPGRTVTGLDSMDLIWGLGSFHCLSQQEPAGN